MPRPAPARAGLSRPRRSPTPSVGRGVARPRQVPPAAPIPAAPPCPVPGSAGGVELTDVRGASEAQPQLQLPSSASGAAAPRHRSLRPCSRGRNHRGRSGRRRRSRVGPAATAQVQVRSRHSPRRGQADSPRGAAPGCRPWRLVVDGDADAVRLEGGRFRPRETEPRRRSPRRLLHGLGLRAGRDLVPAIDPAGLSGRPSPAELPA